MFPVALSLALSTSPQFAVAGSNCAQPNVPAAVSSVLFSGVPSIAMESGEHGITELRVTLSANTGRPQHVVVERSSGLLAVDDLAMQYAQNTIFKPEMQNCNAVAGEYLYEVEA